MSALSDALAAMKRVLAGTSGYATTWDWYADRRIVAKAAPDMAAWIEKALPWVEKRAESLRTLLILARAEKDEAYAELIADASEELAALDALLAEAKGEGK